MYFIVFPNVFRPFKDAVPEHTEIFFQQDNIGRFLCNIDCVIHRDPDICSPDRGSIVDPVPKIADHVIILHQCPDDPFFLGRGNPGEYVRLLNCAGKGVAVHPCDLAPFNYPADREVESRYIRDG